MQTHNRLNLFTLVLAAIGLLTVLGVAMLFLGPLGLQGGEAAPPEANYQPPTARATSTVLPTPFRPRVEPTTSIALVMANTGGVLQAPVSDGNAIPSAQASVVPNPPVEGQGGTCIGAHVIDYYEQALGAGLKIIITPIAPPGDPIETTTGDYGVIPPLQNLPGGRYRVELVLPTEYRAYTSNAVEVTLSGIGKDCAHVRFKLEAMACLIVFKLDDDTTNNVGKPVGIPDWEITLTQGGTVLKERTDGLGAAVFRNIPPGPWLISEEIKLGWEFAGTIPSGYSNPAGWDLESPYVAGTCEKFAFINRQVEGVIDVIKQDIYGNRLQGWNIYLRRVDGTQPTIPGVTGPDGVARFSNVTPGLWEVSEGIQDGWGVVGDSKILVEITKHGEYKIVTFTNQPLGCVDGYKINHLEQGLPHWQIEARKGDELVKATTDEHGYFKLELELGTWTISEVMQPGWTAVTASEFEVEVVEPFKCRTVRFKNRTEFACVDVYKRDEFQMVGLPDWSIVLEPQFGGTPQGGVTDGTGWVRFSGLTPGRYKITEILRPGWQWVKEPVVHVTLEASGTCAVVTFINRQENREPPIKPVDTGHPTNSVYGSTGCYSTYTVKAGDNLFRIALNHGVKLQKLRDANNLNGTNAIRAGMNLCIPNK